MAQKSLLSFSLRNQALACRSISGLTLGPSNGDQAYCSTFEQSIAAMATVAHHYLHNYTRDLLTLVSDAYSSGITLEWAQTVRHHHLHTTENSRNWMSNWFYPVQLTSKSRNPPMSDFPTCAWTDFKWSKWTNCRRQFDIQKKRWQNCLTSHFENSL